MNPRISPHIFRAYDIRGLYNKDLSSSIMFEIGLGFGSYVKEVLNGTEITVGCDIRQSSMPLVYAFISGVATTGINAIFAGTTAFGQALFAGWSLKSTAIAFITASHLPPEWNGIKFYHADGVGFSEGELMIIRDRTLNKEHTKMGWKDVGTVINHDITQDYINFFLEKFNFTTKLKVALDCGGGSTALSAPEVFSKLGLEVVPIYCDPDPTFSGRPSDPKPKNLTKVIETVKAQGCDFGVAFDGDGDRSVIIDNQGKVLSADETGIIIGTYGLKQKHGTIIVNVECSKAVKEQLEPLGYNVKQIPVGHTYLTIEAKQEKSPLGIESSGHIIIPEYFLFDDALVTPLKVAEILNNLESRLSDLVEKIPTYPMKKVEIDCEDELKFDIVEAFKLEAEREFEEINTMDGVRIETKEGWILIRPSNTSPIIRMTIEADDREAIEAIQNRFEDKLKSLIDKASK
ncbi:MAG: phosphomannomutase/phosphoglucomutase [Candidatus Heimdallarchaeota archaeon]|nr:phosphomannomutase/phosphoglucomutase [Candidatus Heimdallarchaeota archaeon]